MRVSTEIGSASQIVGEELAVEYVAKAGFDCWDFSMFTMESWASMPGRSDFAAFARRLKQIGLDNGITCNQAHAPFPSVKPSIRSDYLKAAIECTAEAGGHICIVHPGNNLSVEENAQLYHEILPFAKACGIKIAAENMWNWDDEQDQASFAACSTPEDFCHVIDAVNDPHLVACLDIGHAEMRGLHCTAPAHIHALGHRLQALHLHDNDRWHDSHQIPFSMDIDWDAVVTALRDIGYAGDFTLECDSYLRGRTPEQVPEGLRAMHDAVRRLAAMFEAK